MPIRNRIDMLSTGVKSPIGIKVSGQSLADIDGAAEQIEEAAKTVPGVVSAIAERLTGGRYVEVSVDRLKAARWGLTVAGVQSYVKSAVGGDGRRRCRQDRALSDHDPLSAELARFA